MASLNEPVPGRTFRMVARHRTAQALVADQLRMEIMAGELPPGSRVLQSDVAARMETSTTPVREAIRELAAGGLLRVDPHRGVVVAEPNDTELQELYQLRMLLEPLSIRKTIKHATDSDYDELEGLLDLMDQETDGSRWAMLNQEFHATMAELSQSPLLTEVLSNLRDRSMIYVAARLQFAPEHFEQGNTEHRDLVTWCRQGDAKRAVEVIKKHLESTVDVDVRNFVRDGFTHRKGAATETDGDSKSQS